jgi:hypothetical protein
MLQSIQADFGSRSALARFILVIVSLAVLSIPLHELGHYLAAQALGAENVRFGFSGIDPVVLHRTIGSWRDTAIWYTGGYAVFLAYLAVWLWLSRRTPESSSLRNRSVRLGFAVVGFLQLGIGTVEGALNDVYLDKAFWPAAIIMVYSVAGLVLHWRVQAGMRSRGSVRTQDTN